jgi:hypothetical protein
LRNRGVLFSTVEGLHFANASTRAFLSWEDIFSLRKIKYAIFDNSIEAVVKKGVKKIIKKIVLIKQEQIVLHKFIGIENRNNCYVELYRLHVQKQSTMAVPSVFVVDTEAFEVDDEEEFNMVKKNYGIFFSINSIKMGSWKSMTAIPLK